ncbi:mitochondrial carrier protein, putative [Bodo saltans]|uniref:Mitochondrial carrier protein, putative n=1 Tax=Bodo saltans TaxID=75058 RepID=A0A0S4JQQ1_BODSA|nr:mitochondrial carrier protein, putative [Bodo saltans]|eukprot:CUG93856.1 mitochondrial carrier protein, putative [Bodo saltans]
MFSSQSHNPLETTAKVSASSVLATFALYPYRDLVKSWTWPPHVPPASFALARYQGFIENPGHLALLASGPVVLYTGYDIAGGGAGGAVVGGVLHSAWKTSMRMFSVRMRQQKRNGDAVYTSMIECIRTSTRSSGVWSWFPGLIMTALVSMSWHGAALVALSSRYDNRRHQSHHSRGGRGMGGLLSVDGGGGGGSFVGDWWVAFRAHSFLAFLTCPIRNVCRSALHATERSGGVHTAQAWVAGETAIFREAAAVAPAMLKTQGISFFLHGSVRTMFKTSVPFGFTYAVFRAMNGQLG